MNKVLVLFAHPRFEKSKTNRALLAGIDKIEGVTLHDLYEEYPDFNIDIEREQALLLEHQIMVWHFPFYMYSAPALLKQWMDVVLEYGWARGSKGNALSGKTACAALTAGGNRQVYAQGALHRFTIREFLVPFEQSAELCKMSYLPPFVVHGTHGLTALELAEQSALYHNLLARLVRGQCHPESLLPYDYINDWLSATEGQTNL